MMHLKNWREVWPSYFAGHRIPPLELRRGIILHHTQNDGPVPLVLEIFGEKCYRRHIQEPSKGVIIDIGANIGAFTLEWANSSENLIVHAYEPNPETNRTLRLNVQSNNFTERVTVFDEAVGRSCSTFNLWTNVPSLIASGYDINPPTSEAVSISVQMIDLNEVISRAGATVELLKIDAEGAEADILEGATQSNLKKVKQVILEYHDYLCPFALARCRRVLEAAGFHCVIKPDRRQTKSVGLLYATQ